MAEDSVDLVLLEESFAALRLSRQGDAAGMRLASTAAVSEAEKM